MASEERYHVKMAEPWFDQGPDDGSRKTVPSTGTHIAGVPRLFLTDPRVFFG